MAQHGAVRGFRASINGLHFVNAWPSEPDITVNVAPLGTVTIGDASNGLCGGMVYTVMDVFQAGLPPIPDTTNPATGSTLFNYIVARLFASFEIPGGVLKYYDWMTTPDHDTGVWLAIRRGVSWHTIVEEWPKIKADIDLGMLSPLALVTVATADPTAMGQNHQVCAYAYDLDDANNLTLHLYDPNTSPPDADNVFLSLNLGNPTHTSPITHNVGITEPIRGFFHPGYTFNNPSSLEATPPLPSNAFFVSHSVQSPLVPGQTSSVQVVMQNLGGTTWSASGANPFRLGSQNPQDNSTWGLNRVNMPQTVAPGDEATFTFTITAPTVPGTYNFRWRMVQELVMWFGDFTPNLPVVVQPLPKHMNVSISPYPVPVGHAVTVTVTAKDATTNAAVSGTVTINGHQMGTTGTPFSMMITQQRVRTPDGSYIFEPAPTVGTVTATGYLSASIDFGGI